MTLPSLISAKNKLSKIAENYDPNRYSLKGFDSQALTPTQFRQQLIRNFGINLNDAELGALISLFDSEGEHTVDSMEFITEFFRLGKLERKRVIKQKKERIERIERMKKEEEDKREDALRKSLEAQIAPAWTADDEDSAIRKLTRAAFCYDSSRGGLEAFAKFEYLNAAQFREQFKLNLDTKFTVEENAALVNLFGDFDNKIVYCREFLNNFFRIRRNELDRYNRVQNMITKERQLQQVQRQEEKIEKYCKLTVAKIEPFTEKDKASAINKIRIAAAYSRPNPFINAVEKSFEPSDLTPTAFKELLRNNFYIHLTPAELDAMLTLFEFNEDGTISCPKFMRTFHQIGFEEHARILQEKRERAEYLRRKEVERKQKRLQSAIALVLTRVEWPDIPPADDSSPLPFSDSSEITSPDASMQGGSSLSTASKVRKLKSRRPTVAALLSPNKMAEQLAKSDLSLTQLFPKASDDTKDFILQIEEQDRQISRMKATRSAMRRETASSRQSSKNRSAKLSGGERLSPIASKPSTKSPNHGGDDFYLTGTGEYEMEFVPPPDDFLGQDDRPRTVHSSSKQRLDNTTRNMSQAPDEFLGDFDSYES